MKIFFLSVFPKRLVVLSGCLLSILLISCKGSRPVVAGDSKSPTDSNPDSLFASIERTPCFGRCPTYVISIYKSGYVVYKGKQWVPNTGIFYTFISKKQLAEISDMADKIGFAELKEAYHDPNIVDVPSTFTTFRINGKLKRIDNTFGDPPQGLIDFEKFLDDLFTNTQWIKISDKIED